MIHTDNEFKQLIPAMSQDEYHGLKASILKEGCRDALIVWNGTIIDGHNRYAICTEHNIQFKTKDIEFDSRDAAKDWIYQNQLARRNLTDELRSYVRGKQYELRKKMQGAPTGNINAKKQSAHNEHFVKTCEIVAEEHNVKQATIRRDAEYARAVDDIAKTQPELKDKILNRDIKTRKKEVVAISRQPEEKQKKVFDTLISGEVSSLSHAIKKTNHEEVALKSDISNKYRVVYADPPWKYGNQTDEAMPGTTIAETHYPCMSIIDLCDMPVKDIVEENAVLFMWTTSPFLEDVFRVISTWGFKYKTSFVWDKIKHNMGFYNSVRHEFLLVATRGSCTPDVKKLFDSVVSEERTEHSKKPEVFREIIDTLYTHGKKIEIFARKETKGWDVYGNQINK